MIQVIRGSIFDSKCDMIVIPCNILGGISNSVYHELMAHSLPTPVFGIEQHCVTFLDNISTFTSASVIAYAASVGSYGASSKLMIEDIAIHIKAYCREHSLRKVNIPLLGTGAGGMTPTESFRIMQEVFETDSLITLCIYAFSDAHYQEISTLISPYANDEIKNPRVFISYTGTDPENRRWVKEFACRLRKNGVDARIDMFHLRPGQDLHQWMTNEVIMADKVLLICDKYYAEKADTRRSGVGWETMIILGDMLSTQEQTKYIGIIRDKDIDESLPVYVRSKYSLNWSEEGTMEREFNDLLLYLFDCDIEPPIGAIPTFIKNALAAK